jgi:hypothetical protein
MTSLRGCMSAARQAMPHRNYTYTCSVCILYCRMAFCSDTEKFPTLHPAVKEFYIYIFIILA